MDVTASDGTRIAYSLTGSGPGLVIVSGALLAGRDYAALAERLCDRFTVHLMDRRGRGGSGPQGPRYSLDTEITDLGAVLKATGARIVVGHSFGGLVALQAALRSTGEIDRVAVYEAGVPVDGSVPSAFIADVERALARGRLGSAFTHLTRGLELDGFMRRWPRWLRVAASALLLRTAGRDLRATLPLFPIEARAALAVDGPASAYAGMPVPVLWVVGAEGPGFLRRAAADVVPVMPGAVLVTLPAAGHDAPQSEPDRVADVMAAFLAA